MFSCLDNCRSLSIMTGIQVTNSHFRMDSIANLCCFPHRSGSDRTGMLESFSIDLESLTLL